jgi:MFS family permease
MAVEDKSTYKWFLVASLWVIGCLNYMDRQAIFSAFPLLKKELGMSDVQLGLLGSAFLWCYSASSPLAGYLGDRFRRKSVILCSLLIFSLATFATGLASAPSQLIWLRGLLGLSEALYLPAALALIADYHSGGTRSTAIGIHQTSLLAGGILGAIFAGYMGQHYGWRNAFYFLGLSGVLVTFLMMALIRETIKGESDFSTAQDVRVDRTEPLLRTLRSILTTPTVLAVMFCGLSISMTGWLVMAWMPAYLYERFGFSLTQAAFNGVFYISVTTAVGILAGSVLADRWTRRDRRGRMWVQLIGLSMGFPAIALFGFTKTAGAVLICLVVFGFARGLWDCNNMPIFCDVVPPASRSTTYGVFNLANTLGGGVSVIIAGILKQRLGIGLTLSMFSLMLLASAILTCLAVKRFVPNDMKQMREKLAELSSTLPMKSDAQEW